MERKQHRRAQDSGAQDSGTQDSGAQDSGAQDSGRAVVVGGGVAGLVAAKELAAAGFAVTVLESAPVWGGCVGVHEVAGLSLDSGAESFATRTSAVADLVADLGLEGRLAVPDPVGAWVWLPDGPLPLPRTGILGIPADLDAPEVRAALGRSGVLRAALDSRLPATVGTTEAVCSVADLVQARMGRRVLERLVAPVVAGVHSADPELLDVDMVAPGLRNGIRVHGSLAASVAALREATAGRSGGGKAGSAVGGLEGGMNVLIPALVEQLRASGVTLLPGHRVQHLGRSGSPARRWSVDWTSGDRQGSQDADVLVVATDGPTAVSLLGPEVPALRPLAPARGPDVTLVTLVVDVPELDAKPRGTGILVAPQTAGIKAKALTHATAKWDWLAAATGPGTHVLRLSYGRAGSPDPAAAVRLATPGPTAAEQFADALADATTLLGVQLKAADVLGWDIVRWRGALPFAAVGHRARMAQVRALVAAEPGLRVTGGWVAGNGLAAVVADAQAQVAELTAAAGQTDM